MILNVLREIGRIRNAVFLVVFAAMLTAGGLAIYGPPGMKVPARAAIDAVVATLGGSKEKLVKPVPGRCWRDSQPSKTAYALAAPLAADGYPVTTLDRMSIRAWLTGQFYAPLDSMLAAYD